MKTAESKTQRWNMRVAEDVDAIVRLAAEQTDQPLTDFVVQAARVVAEDALADRRVFRLDETAWDEFVEILDRPARPIPEPRSSAVLCQRVRRLARGLPEARRFRGFAPRRGLPLWICVAR